MLTAISSEEYVCVAWDSAGVTTGPITVPLVIAMGLGLGDSIMQQTGAISYPSLSRPQQQPQLGSAVALAL